MAFAFQQEELAVSFRDGPVHVEHGGVGRHGAAVDPEDGEAAGIRVGHRLEDLGRQGPVRVRYQLHPGIGAGFAPRDRASLLRGGQEEVNGVQQQAGSQVGGRRAAQHRDEGPLEDPLLQAAVNLLRGELPFFQEFFDQGVVAFGGVIHQIAPQLGDFVLKLIGDGPAGLGATRGPGVGLQIDEVHHPLKAGLLADGKLEGHGLHFQDILNALDCRGKVGPFPVQLIDKEQAGQLIVVGGLPDLFRAHLDAVHRVDHHHRPVPHVEDGPGIRQKVVVSGGVGQINGVFFPLVMVKGAGNGDLAFNFLGFVVEDGGAVIHPPQPGSGPGGEQQGLCQRGFAAAAVPDEDQIADICCFARH